MNVLIQLEEAEEADEAEEAEEAGHPGTNMVEVGPPGGKVVPT